MTISRYKYKILRSQEERIQARVEQDKLWIYMVEKEIKYIF